MTETQPLLVQVEEPRRRTDPSLVDFDPKYDPDNPLEWSDGYRRGVVSLLALMAFTVTLTCTGIMPIAEQIIFDLDGTRSRSASIMLITIWEFGEAAGPLLIAPLSEIYGRYPVFNVANIGFILGVVLAALSQSTGMLIFARFFTGFAVASNVLNPSIIGDIFPTESRGSGMALIMLAPLVGGAIGPAVSGVFAEYFGWRSYLWMCALVAIICEILFFTLLRETYKVAILERRAARLRKETQDESLKCAWESENATKSGWAALRMSISRPFTVLMGSSVLQIMSIYGGLAFTFFYILATTLPGILRDVYGFTPALTGSAYLCFSAGSTCGIIMVNFFLDRTYVMLGKSRDGGAIPEYRLPFLIGAAICLPIIVALYGGAPDAKLPVWVFLLSVTLLGFALIVIMIPLSSYVVDAFGVYSASAMTMVLIARCLTGTLLPLAIPPLTDALGLGYGFLVLAAVCVALLPLPIVVLRYGSRWRQYSVYTRND